MLSFKTDCLQGPLPLHSPVPINRVAITHGWWWVSCWASQKGWENLSPALLCGVAGLLHWLVPENPFYSGSLGPALLIPFSSLPALSIRYLPLGGVAYCLNRSHGEDENGLHSTLSNSDIPLPCPRLMQSPWHLTTLSSPISDSVPRKNTCAQTKSYTTFLESSVDCGTIHRLWLRSSMLAFTWPATWLD